MSTGYLKDFAKHAFQRARGVGANVLGGAFALLVVHPLNLISGLSEERLGGTQKLTEKFLYFGLDEDQIIGRRRKDNDDLENDHQLFGSNGWKKFIEECGRRFRPDLYLQRKIITDSFYSPYIPTEDAKTLAAVGMSEIVVKQLIGYSTHLIMNETGLSEKDRKSMIKQGLPQMRFGSKQYTTEVAELVYDMVKNSLLNECRDVCISLASNWFEMPRELRRDLNGGVEDKVEPS